MPGPSVRMLLFLAAASGLFLLHRHGIWAVELSEGRTLWEFLALACGILAAQQFAVSLVRWSVGRRGGPAGEVQMLTEFVGFLAALVVVITLLYSIGVLHAFGVMAAGFAGLLLGWSLQAPVSGIAAWALVTIKRPFRVGDRVLFPTLGLNGDVKQVGLMYTVLDQVGGAIGSEEAIGRDILIPNAMLFNQVAVNYTPKAQAAYFLDEVVIRLTYDSEWDSAEKIMIDAAREVTADIIRETGQEPYIRSDIWDYGILLRLRYMTMAKDRPRITHEIVKRIFKAVQRDPRVDMAIPYVYSYRKSSQVLSRDVMPGPEARIEEIQVAAVIGDGLEEAEAQAETAETGELMANIQRHGLLQPIVVSATGQGRYRILAGQKRFIACRRLGWETVPAVIRREEDGGRRNG